MIEENHRNQFEWSGMIKRKFCQRGQRNDQRPDFMAFRHMVRTLDSTLRQKSI